MRIEVPRWGMTALVATLAIAGLGRGAAGAEAAGGTAKPPNGAVSPFVTPTLPDPAFSVDPALIHGFDVTGFIQDMKANTTNSGCPDETDPSRFGGTVTLNNQTVTIPCNLVVQMPANTLTWADLVHGGDLSLGNGLPSFEIRVVGNVVDGAYIAALAFVSQQLANSGSGVIGSIDYTTGELHVDTGDPAHPATVVINDPKGRFGRAQSPDARFSVDDANPTIHAATGYPMCVPRVHTDPTLALATEDDPLCPQANRPKPSCRNFSIAGVAPPASGELSQAPAGQRYCSQYVMPGPGAATGPDPTQQAPFEVGDYIQYSGTLIDGTNGAYVSAHTIEANVGIYTQPGSQPSYLAIGEFGVGTADPNATAANGAAQETQDRIFLESETTDVKTPVDIYMQDVDPTTGALRNRWVTPFEMTGESGGGITTQNTGPQPQRARIRATKAPAGLLSQPTRTIRVAVRSLCTPAGPDGQTALDACFENAPTVANGLVAGQYFAPVFEFIFPEGVKPGDLVVPNDLWHLPFLRFGEGSTTPSDVGPSVGPLTPTPWGAPVSVPVAKLSPASLTFADRDTGTTSAAQTIKVSNTGDAPLSISAVSLKGPDAGDFASAKSADTCSGASVAPGASCSVDVTFSPADAGAKTASLSIADNAKGSPHTATLTGTATTAPAAAPEPAPAPAAADRAPTPAASAVTSPSAPAPSATASGAAPAPLGPVGVTVPATLSAADPAPITVGATVPAGANVVQISVFAVAGPAGAAQAALAARAIRRPAAGKRLIATVYRNTPAAKRYTFRLTEGKLRHLKPGRYRIEVRAGRTRTSLGPATVRTLRITKGAVKRRR
jgi:hypothetical protein